MVLGATKDGSDGQVRGVTVHAVGMGTEGLAAPALPQWIRWSKVEWQEWIDRNQTEAGNENTRDDVITVFQLHR